MTDAEARLGLVVASRNHLMLSTARPASGEQGLLRGNAMNGRWLGHRDWCGLQWGGPCECPCTTDGCPGVHDCTDQNCPVAAYLAANELEEGTDVRHQQ